jgi:hypothetical protein
MRLIKSVFEGLLLMFAVMTLITDLQSQSPGQTPPAVQTPTPVQPSPAAQPQPVQKTPVATPAGRTEPLRRIKIKMVPGKKPKLLPTGILDKGTPA